MGDFVVHGVLQRNKNNHTNKILTRGQKSPAEGSMYFGKKPTKMTRNVSVFLYKIMPNNMGFLLSIIASGHYSPEEGAATFKEQLNQPDPFTGEGPDLLDRANHIREIRHRLEGAGIREVTTPEERENLAAFFELITPKLTER